MTATPPRAAEPPIVENGASSARMRAVWHAALVALVSGGVIVGVWHDQIAVRALWAFRSNEPLSSWVTVFAGPVSTLPAALLGAFHRRWSAVWLIGGALVSLGGMIANELGSERLLSEAETAAGGFLVRIALPMVLLGLGVATLHRRLVRNDPIEGDQERRRRVAIWRWMVGVYLMLSVLALFVGEWSAFNRAIEAAVMVMAAVLGPLTGLATSRVLGAPLFLAETVVVLGLLWIAMTSRSWSRSRTALLGVFVSWTLSGFLVLVLSGIWV